jgi:glycosyltransferase involved in cell wall biosynthesis
MDFANELSKKFDVAVFSPDFGGKKESYLKVPVTWFSWGGPAKKFGDWNVFSPFSIWLFLKLLIIGSKKAVVFVRTETVDYCLAAWSIPSGIYAFFVKKTLGTPYGIWNLGSDINKYIRFPVLKQLITLSLKNADHVFANSLDLVKKVSEISGRKVYLLPAVTKFKKVVENSKIKKTDKFKFLFVGRLEKVKGPDILIQAIRLLKQNNPNLDFSVDILGGGSMEAEIKEKIKNYELSKVVQMRGWANEEEVSGFMNSRDCLLVTSRSESLPLVILEAAKSNLPVIASNVGDCSFLIKKYKIGFSFENQDIKRLADCMEKITNSKNLNKSGFSRLVRDYSLEKTVNLFTEKVLRVVK